MCLCDMFLFPGGVKKGMKSDLESFSSWKIPENKLFLSKSLISMIFWGGIQYQNGSLEVAEKMKACTW